MPWLVRRMWMDGIKAEFRDPEADDSEAGDVRRVDDLSDLVGSGLTPRTD